MTSRLKRKSRTMPLRNLKISNALCNMSCDRAAEQKGATSLRLTEEILTTIIETWIPESYRCASACGLFGWCGCDQEELIDASLTLKLY